MSFNLALGGLEDAAEDLFLEFEPEADLSQLRLIFRADGRILVLSGGKFYEILL